MHHGKPAKEIHGCIRYTQPSQLSHVKYQLYANYTKMLRQAFQATDP